MNDFSGLVEQEIPRLRRYARALTRGVGPADDLVQDTLVRAIARRHLWQLGTDLRAWLFTIMHNESVNLVRRSVREGRAAELGDTWPVPPALSDPVWRLSLRDLDRALARLSEQQREVVLLIGLEAVPYREAATILGVPVGTIRSRLSRARGSLRSLMDMPEVPRRRAVRPSRAPCRSGSPNLAPPFDAKPRDPQQGLGLAEQRRAQVYARDQHVG